MSNNSLRRGRPAIEDEQNRLKNLNVSLSDAQANNFSNLDTETGRKVAKRLGQKFLAEVSDMLENGEIELSVVKEILSGRADISCIFNPENLRDGSEN